MLSEHLLKSFAEPDSLNNFIYHNLNKLVSLIRQIEEELGSDFKDLYVQRKMRKGSFLIQQGEITKQFNYLVKGIARTYVVTGEKEQTMRFSFPNEFINDLTSSTFNQPTAYTIQFLTDAIVLEFDWKKVNSYKADYPVLLEIEKLIMTSYITALERRILGLLFNNAQQRYEDLLQLRPQLIRRIPLIHVASYIGCSPEQVSRIRANLCKAKEERVG